MDGRIAWQGLCVPLQNNGGKRKDIVIIMEKTYKANFKRLHFLNGKEIEEKGYVIKAKSETDAIKRIKRIEHVLGDIVFIK